MPNWILIVTLGFAALGALAVLTPLWLHLRASRPAKPATPKPPRRRDQPPPPAVTLRCPACQAEVAFARTDLRTLTSPEIALIVSQHKEAARRDLAEAACPRCEACLTFFTDVKPPQFLGANIFLPHERTNRCAECGEPLKRLPWSPDAVPTRTEALDALDPRYGLDCEHCGAVCCVACCEEVSRNRTTDNTLMCPRCRRKSMDALRHF